MAGTNTPNLNLYKPNRTDNVSVIADLNDNMDKIDTFAGNVATAESNSKGTVAIVEDGNTCTHVGGIASGQYVVWKGLLYKATQAISVGTTLSTSTNLSAITDGIANELNSNISTLNSNISTLNSKITKHLKSGTTTCDLPLYARNVVATVRYGIGGVLQALSFVFPIGATNTSISGLTFTQGYYLNTTSYAFCQISYNSSTEKITITNLTVNGTEYSSTSEISVTYEI